jgi:hypothetical protein
MSQSWNTRLRSHSRYLVVLTTVCLALGRSTPASAQGITTGAIRGTVRAQNGKNVDGAVIQAVNTETGFAIQTRARNGRFIVQGLATSTPYRIVVRSLGYELQTLDSVKVALGEQSEINFTLIPVATPLETVTVTESDERRRTPSKSGVGTSISDSLLRRLPTLDRDLYDFVRLVPQVGTRLGLTGGGANFRYNSYLIDGVSDRQLQGNNVMGAGTTGGKSISIEAIQEYQVLLSPYEARYGDFTGMLVNAVTRSGTNTLRGSTFGYVRNEKLARTNSFVGDSPYRREQFGFTVGGPIVRDRMHFFIASEFQHAEAPAPGPYIGQKADVLPPVPVAASDVERFATLLNAKGIDAGDGGRVTTLNPATTVFGRVDLALPERNTRVVFLHTYSAVDLTRFARASNGASFPLSSNAWTLRTAKHSSGVQVFTQVSKSIFNELMLSYLDRPVVAMKYSPSPSIQANVNGTGTATLIAGPPLPAGGVGSASSLFEIADQVVVQPLSGHTLEIGAHAEFFSYHAVGVRGAFGQWRFPTLNALATDAAGSYSITKDFGSAEAPVRGVRPSAYISDDWQARENLSISVGLRADALSFSSHPTFNPAVDSIFQRRTSDYPKSSVRWSPRFGFIWVPAADRTTRVRGGAGIFVGPAPLGWLLGPVRSNGAGVKTLTCTGAIGSGKVPKFVADPAVQPLICPDGKGFSDGPVALVDRDLRMAESFRTSLAIDQRLPWRVNATVEALYSRVRSDFLFVNANLIGPQAIDSHGRVMYGTVQSNGLARPALVIRDRFTEVIDLRNHSLGHAWSLTAQAGRPFSERLEVRAAYTYSRVRDVQSLTNQSAAAPSDIWAGGRPLSGQHDELSTGISAFEVPHRVVVAATFAAPWIRWTTDLSLYYVGESGTPFTFNDSTDNGFGDLNADGTSADDPIYVPRNTADPAEIVLDAQSGDFDRFIRDTPCLRRQRGTIVARNSCRGPWVHTSNASLRQSLRAIGGHAVSLQVEVFNLLNLLNPSWGLFKEPNDKILQHVGQTSGTPSQPIFHFDATNAGTSTQNLESGYQLQLSLRYSF